eukprot:1158371-Pelagomonas_calceolata.AAC.11
MRERACGYTGVMWVASISGTRGVLVPPSGTTVPMGKAADRPKMERQGAGQGNGMFADLQVLQWIWQPHRCAFQASLTNAAVASLAHPQVNAVKHPARALQHMESYKKYLVCKKPQLCSTCRATKNAPCADNQSPAAHGEPQKTLRAQTIKALRHMQRHQKCFVSRQSKPCGTCRATKHASCAENQSPVAHAEPPKSLCAQTIKALRHMQSHKKCFVCKQSKPCGTCRATKNTSCAENQSPAAHAEPQKALCDEEPKALQHTKPQGVVVAGEQEARALQLTNTPTMSFLCQQKLKPYGLELRRLFRLHMQTPGETLTG